MDAHFDHVVPHIGLELVPIVNLCWVIKPDITGRFGDKSTSFNVKLLY